MASHGITRADMQAVNLPRRRVVNRAMELLAWLAAAIAVGALVVVVWSVARRGAPALNLDLLTKQPVQFAIGPVKQGLANAFAGSLVLVGLATLMTVPVGILIALYLTEYAAPSVRSLVSLALDVLNGVPAIVIAIFVYGLVVVGHGQSGYAGAFALACLMLPLVTRSTMEVLLLVPGSLREASLGLGIPRWRTTLSIVLPQTLGGIVTGTVLAIARVAGETAPLLFTSSLVGTQVSWSPSHALQSIPVARVAGETAPLLFTSSLVGTQVSWSPSHALQSIPVAIYELSESPDPADHARAWAAATVLLVFILLTSLGARWLATRGRRRLSTSR